jgi:hypothetical protein
LNLEALPKIELPAAGRERRRAFSGRQQAVKDSPRRPVRSSIKQVPFRAVGFSLWPLAAVPAGGGQPPPGMPAFMRHWLVWAGILGGLALLFVFDYMWETDFTYWISRQVRAVLQFILP